MAYAQIFEVIFFSNLKHSFSHQVIARDFLYQKSMKQLLTPPPKYSLNPGFIPIFGFVVVIPIPVLVGEVGLVVVEHHASVFNLLALVHALHQRHE